MKKRRRSSQQGNAVAVFCLVFPESKETLTDIIEADEGTHADKHGTVVLNCGTHSAEDEPHSGFCKTVGKKVTDGDVQDETEDNFGIFAFVLKGEMLIEKIAQNAAEYVIGSGGDPVSQMKYVVKQEHDAGSEKGIGDADQNEFPESFIQKFTDHTIHPSMTGVFGNIEL